jgi:uncharacterized protein (UPF0147 family)
MARRRGSRWVAAALVAVAFACPIARSLQAADGDVPSTAKLLASSDDYRVRVGAALKLGGSGDARARKPLEAALDDAHPNVRQAAAAALAKLGDKGAIPALRAREKKESNAPTKAAITQAIATLEKSTGLAPATAATGSPGGTAATTTAPKTLDWAKTKFVMKLQKAENSTTVRGSALALVLNAATRDRLNALPEIYVLPDDASAAGIIKLAASKGVPVVGVNAALVSMDQGSFAGDVKVQAKVSLAFTRLDIVKSSVEGNASSIGSKAATTNPASLARLQDMAVDGAVASAMAKAPTAIKSAAN